MKTFQSRSLLESRTVGLLKGLTLLFLGASVAVLATYGLTIDPGINNATQYIQKIILTSDGTNVGTTGVVLRGSDGDAYFAGDVGIGNPTPSEKLEISGGNFLLNNGIMSLHVNGSPSLSFLGAASIINQIHTGDAIITSWFNNMQFVSSLTNLLAGTPSMTLTTGGNVGIGTSNPGYTLEVSGTGKFSQGVLATRYCDQNGSNCKLISQIMTGVADDSAKVIKLNGGSTVGDNELLKRTSLDAVAGSDVYSVVGNVGIGTGNPQAKLEIYSGGTITLNPDLNQSYITIKSNPSSSGMALGESYGGLFGLLGNFGGLLYLFAGSDPVAGITITTGGKVGVGTSDPKAALDVNGPVRVGGSGFCDSSTEGAIRYNGTRFIGCTSAGPKFFTMDP